MNDEDNEVRDTDLIFHDSKYVTPSDVKRNNDFTIMSVNVQSMNNKFQQIRDVTHEIDPSILCLQETWGKNDVKDYSIKFYHKPHIITRPGTGMNLGGGVGIWVKTNLDFEILKSPFKSKVIETATIRLPTLKFIIINVYCPFGNKGEFIEEMYKHVCCIKKQHPGHNYVAVGDFNMNLINPDGDANSLLEMFTNEGFHQGVTGPTRLSESNTLIDHVYSNSKLPTHTDIVMAGLSDHEITLTTFNKKIKTKKEFVTKRWLKPAHYGEIADILRGEDWSPMLQLSADKAAEFLEQAITKAMDEIAPIKSKKVSTKKLNQWSTVGIRTSTKNSAYLHKQVKSKTLLKEEYKNYKKILQRVIRKAKNDYYNNLLKAAGKDTRKIWGIINEVIDRKQSRHIMPAKFKSGEEVLTSKKAIADGFNNYFASIGKEMADKLPNVPGYEDYLSQSNMEFELEEVEVSDIEEIMKKQQPKMSCGIDSINNKIVKVASKELAYPMTLIVNKSIREGCVPAIYKLARIVPLYKKGPTDEWGNYRPVSLLPSLSKILEKAICAQMMLYLSKNNLICDDQFGFRRRSQTTHVVQSMLNTIYKAAIQEQVTVATYIDLSKAFDCLQYNQLFTKMKSLGFKDRTMRWFESYLSGRKQCTDIEGNLSSKLDVHLGVPQGSILGPILFIIYVNDINRSGVDCKFVKFADDTTVLTTGSTLHEAVEKMNVTMASVGQWFSKNKLNLNPGKTRYMIFNSKTEETNLVKVNNQFIERVWDKGKEKSFKLVGIHIDERLKWTYHIDHVSKKVNSANYALGKSAKELDVRNKKLLYSGIVHSHLVYGLPIWGFATKGRLNQLLVKQKLAIRKIHNLPYKEHTLYFFTKSEILQLPELIQYMTLSYIKSGLVGPQHVQNLWTRNTQGREGRYSDRQLRYETTSKQWIHNLAPIAQVKLWNSKIQEGMQTVMTDLSFKQRIKDEFLIQYCETLKSEGYNIDMLLQSETMNNFPYNASQS